MPKSTIILKEEAQRRIEEAFPNSNFLILEYKDAHSPIKIQCKKCQKILDFKNLTILMGRLNLCKCSKDFQNTKEKVEYLLQKNNFKLLSWERSDKKVTIQCKNCNSFLERFPSEIFKHPSYCYYCNNSQTQPMSVEDIQKKIDSVFSTDKYTIKEYRNWREKALIKHEKCNLIFKQNIGHFLEGCGCPKCYRKRSKGEIKISEWLKNNKINFSTQFYIKYEDNTHGYFDFFLKERKIAIEYNGEQHYDKNNFFNSKKSGNFKIQEERDNKKRDYCRKNNIILIEIPYWELNNIDNILSSKFNDYPFMEQV